MRRGNNSCRRGPYLPACRRARRGSPDPADLRPKVSSSPAGGDLRSSPWAGPETRPQQGDILPRLRIFLKIGEKGLRREGGSMRRAGDGTDRGAVLVAHPDTQEG